MRSIRLTLASIAVGVAVLASAAGFSPSASAGPNQSVADGGLEVSAIRVGEHDDYTRFVIDLNAKPSFRIFTLQDPRRVVVDLPEVQWKLSSPAGKARMVSEMRFGRYQGGNSRLVMDLAYPVKVARAFVLGPSSRQSRYRLILDLARTSEAAFLASAGRPLAVEGTIARNSSRQSTAVAARRDIPPLPSITAPRLADRVDVLAGQPLRVASRTSPMGLPAANAVPERAATPEKSGGRPAYMEAAAAPQTGGVAEKSSTSSRFPADKAVQQVIRAEARKAVQEQPVLPATRPDLSQVQASASSSVQPPEKRPEQKEADSIQAVAGDRIATSAPIPLPVPRPALPANSAKTVIALDAGHGGIDPGAIGEGGTREKNITLAIARELRDVLQATGRYKVILTRDTDIFIPLRERVAIARRQEADLFISLHADSIRKPELRGLSVYTLSENASDAEAELLANRENKADLIGGMDLSHQDAEVTNILIDLAQRETKNFSAVFARNIVSSMKERSVRLLGKSRRSAGFAVLKAPDVPSVLIELGFLSNGTEERLLRTHSHRQRIAQGIASAINDYFSRQDLIAAAN